MENKKGEFCRQFAEEEPPDLCKNYYVVHEHHAKKLHYDLRLEMKKVLKSWAIPKTPPKEAGIKRLAVQTDDHALAYGKFEGKIPEGNYGAGEVKIWDNGNYKLIEEKDGKIVVKINGRKLNGTYCLIRLKDKEADWLFFKKKS